MLGASVGFMVICGPTLAVVGDGVDGVDGAVGAGGDGALVGAAGAGAAANGTDKYKATR